MDPSRNLVLTESMGTGKTSVGRELDVRLDMEFVDTDELIEIRHGPIERIFAQQGEAAFRKLESGMARELAQRGGHVVATGGRMMLDHANATVLGASGEVFCLVASLDEIHRRVSADELRRERPLLNVADPRRQIAQLLAEREADCREFPQVSTDSRDVASLADEIIELWGDSMAGEDSPAKME